MPSRIALVLLAAFLCAFAGAQTTPITFAVATPTRYASPILAKVHASTHRLEADTVLEGNSCSATAVGPNALLTAGHCEKPTDFLSVDGKFARVEARIHDESDHTIYLLNGITFKDFRVIVPQYDFAIGEHVFLFGNPGKYRDIYRQGYVQAYDQEEKGIYLGFPVSQGDSGAGIWNAAGELVGVLSFTQYVAREDSDSQSTLILSGAYPLEYTKADLARAAAPVPQTFHHKTADEDKQALFDVFKTVPPPAK